MIDLRTSEMCKDGHIQDKWHVLSSPNHSVRCTGGWCWSGVREKYCWLAGGWRLVLELCERKILLAGWRNQTANIVNVLVELQGLVKT